MLVLLGVAGEGNHFTPLLQLGTSLRIASDQQNWQHRLSSSCIRVLCAVCCFISGKIPGDFVPSTRLARALWSSTSSWSSANSQHCPWVIQEGTARASPGHQRFCQHSYLSFMQPCALAHELSVFEPIFTHGAYRDSQ